MTCHPLSPPPEATGRPRSRAAVTIAIALGLLLPVAPGLTGDAHAAPTERNIIFFITDDQGQDASFFGNDVIQLPHLDQLAADGTVFLNAYATTASCSASRSVVMSGLHNHKNGQFGHMHHFHGFSSFPDVAALALPRVLENNGYRTARIGKYHVAPEAVYQFGEVIQGPPRNAVRMAESAREFITRDDDRPFFLYFATSDPHRGGGVDETSPHRPDLFGNLPERGHHPGVEEVFYDPADVIVPPFLPDNEVTRAELAQYYQSCSRIDQGLGRLIEILKEHDLYDRTLIVFTSDHGVAFPGAKTTVWEAGLRVPFVVRNPYADRRGVRNQALISHVDITPSLLDFAGALDHETNGPANWVNPDDIWRGTLFQNENRSGGFNYRSYQGRSWVPIIELDDAEGWDVIHASHTFHEIQMYYPMRVLRDRDYKIIWNIAHPLPYPFASDLWAAPTWQRQFARGRNAPFGPRTVGEFIQRPEFELYDMREDPDETTNLALDERNAELLERYKDKLREFQREFNDHWILKWEYE